MADSSVDPLSSGSDRSEPDVVIAPTMAMPSSDLVAGVRRPRRHPERRAVYRLLFGGTLTHGAAHDGRLMTPQSLFARLGQHSYRVGASIGLVHVGASFQSADDVLRTADHACYLAEREGRNRVAIHETG